MRKFSLLDTAAFSPLLFDISPNGTSFWSPSHYKKGQDDADIRRANITDNDYFFGTQEADILVGESYGSPSDDEIYGDDGNDVIIADHDQMFTDSSNLNGMAGNAFNIDNSGVWSTAENDNVFDDTVPYCAVLITGMNTYDFYTVTVGDGETITVDIDFGGGVFGGPAFDSALALYDANAPLLLTNILAQNEDSATSEGGLGSVTGTDSFVSYTNTTGMALTVLIEISQGGFAIPSGATYLLNVSVSGHAADNTAVHDLDRVYGENGNDILYGGGEADLMFGGNDADFMYGGSGDDELWTDVGSDSAFGGAGDDWLSGADGDDILFGGDGDDQISGDAGRDSVFGGDGNDSVFLTSGQISSLELADGGDGADWLVVIGFNSGGSMGTINLETGEWTPYLSSPTLPNFENYFGQDNLDDVTLIGTNGANTFHSGGGDDLLYGGDGDDILRGMDGSDTLYGGAGDDTLTSGFDTGGDQVDTVYGGAGNDMIRGGYYIDELYGEDGNDTFTVTTDERGDNIYGGAGTDTLDMSGLNAVLSVNINLATGTFIQSFNGFTNSTILSSVENVTGSDVADVIFGGAGNNVLSGGAGDDVIEGGAGADIMTGGTGTDTLSYAFAGAAVILFLGSGTGAGGDAIGDTFSGFEFVVGSQFDDFIEGANGFGLVDAREGNDTFAFNATGPYTSGNFDGDLGTDTILLRNQGDTDLRLLTFENMEAIDMESASGNPRNHIFASAQFGNGLISSSASVTKYAIDPTQLTIYMTGTSLDLSGLTFTGWVAGQDLVQLNGTGVIESITGTSQNDQIFGGDGADILSGFAGNDEIYGGLGDDVLRDGAGTDQLYGADGDDHVLIIASDTDWQTYADSFDGGVGTDTFEVRGYGATLNGTTFNMEAGTFGSAASFSAVTNFENYDGSQNGVSNETVIGTAGANIIRTGGADNIVYGRGGDDLLFGGGGDDRMFGQDGQDTLNGDAGNDRLIAGSGQDVLSGGDGDDTLYGQGGNDTVHGDDGADLLVGGAGADMLYGGDQDDSISGQVDNDTLFGGNGDDQLSGQSGNDALSGEAGADTLNAGGGDDSLFGGSENDLLNGGAGADQAFGGTGDDMINGGAQDDELHGDAGADTLAGNTGNDTLYGDSGADTLSGQAGIDILYGGDDADMLFGGSGSDDLYGGEGNDRLSGGGGIGNDELWGDAGADVFVLDQGFRVDRIKDFEDGTDLIDFSGNALANNFADVAAAAVQLGLTVRIEINANNTVILENFALADLDAGDFIF